MSDTRSNDVHVAAAIIVRDGEAAQDACLREVDEELGLCLGTTFYYDTVESDIDDGRHMTMDCFVCELPADTEPEARVHDEFRWLPQADLLSVEWLPADRGVVTGLGVMWNQIFSAEHL